MLNINSIENLSEIEGENLLSFYLNIDNKKYSPVAIGAKVKDLLKSCELKDNKKNELEKNIFSFLSEVSKGSKSIALFLGDNKKFSFELPMEVQKDLLIVDSIFNLKPLFLLLSENTSMGIFLLDSQRSKFLSVFLGEIDDYKYFKDEVIHKQANGGWSQGRYEHRHNETEKKHLKKSVEFLEKMYRIHKFEYLILRNDPEIENEFKELLSKEISDKIRGHISVDMDAPSGDIISEAMEIERREKKKEETEDIDILLEYSKSSQGKHKIALGLLSVSKKLYDKRVIKLFVNDEYTHPGSFCHFCGFISLDSVFCPYDQTPTSKVKDVISVVIKEAIKEGAEIEVLKNNNVLKELGNIAAFIRDY